MGNPIPIDCIPPDFPDECYFAHAAFQELTTDRQLGFSTGPIPWSSIHNYAKRYNITDLDEFDSFVRMVRVMDNVFLSHRK